MALYVNGVKVLERTKIIDNSANPALAVEQLGSGPALQLTGDIEASGGFKQGYGFMQVDVAASQSAVALDVLGLVGNTEVVMLYAGSILGIAISGNVARTAGTLTVDVTKNGVATGLQAVLDGSNAQYHSATQAKDTDTFAAGDRLGVDITTDGSWAPTTADIVVVVVVEM